MGSEIKPDLRDILGAIKRAVKADYEQVRKARANCGKAADAVAADGRFADHGSDKWLASMKLRHEAALQRWNGAVADRESELAQDLRAWRAACAMAGVEPEHEGGIHPMYLRLEFEEGRQ